MSQDLSCNIMESHLKIAGSIVKYVCEMKGTYTI